MPYLERVAIANLSKLSTALRLLADWARRRSLTPSETVYVSWTRDRHRLRFTKTGDPGVERAWRTHWISPALTEAKRARRAGRQSVADPPGTPARRVSPSALEDGRGQVAVAGRRRQVDVEPVGVIDGGDMARTSGASSSSP